MHVNSKFPLCCCLPPLKFISLPYLTTVIPPFHRNKKKKIYPIVSHYIQDSFSLSTPLSEKEYPRECPFVMHQSAYNLALLG